MTKQIYKGISTFAFSLVLITQSVNASKAVLREEMGEIFSRPKIVTQCTNSDFIREHQEEEYKLLSSSMLCLENKEFERAVDFLKDAISINGSPLGYLYLSALWNDARYHRIVFCAMKSNLISKRTIVEHAFFLRDLGYIFDLGIQYIPAK
jgi:hypothetical protein